MAIDVPKEPKVYTTVYDNFKGVDFTDDVTNVYRRRSPDGLNMLPDIDGRPYKRTGWETVITADDFRTAARKYKTVATDAEVKPIKTYYFELGGHDFMMIFNTLGVFSVSDFNREIYNTSNMVVIDNSLYLNYERTRIEHTTSDLPSNLNPHTGVFFEGNGDAGFYVYCGLDVYEYKQHIVSQTSIHNYYEFKKIDPYVPTVLIGCKPNGTGTAYEQVNLLTSERTVAYSCDGASTQFVVPNGFVSGFVVEARNTVTGEWEVKQSGYSGANGVITFNSAPPEVYEGEDNMRVTYTPDGEGAYTYQTSASTAPATMIVARKERLVRYMYEDGTISAWQSETTPQYTWSFGACTLTMDRMVEDEPITLHGSNPGVTLTDTYAQMTMAAYNSAYTVTPKQALWGTNYHYNETTISPSPIDEWLSVSRAGVYPKQQHGERRVNRFYRCFASYTKYAYQSGDTSAVNESRYAFQSCTRTAVYGNGVVNNVFMTASDAREYNTRMWWSGATDPTYFPDLNYIEVGSTDDPIKGLLKIDNYLGVIKKGSGTNTSVYLTYPTSFLETTTYAIKQAINGIGAISNGAYNILEDEPLFLSNEGVMAIETNDEERQLRNRSFFVNKRLIAEPNLESAVSFIYDGMYWLAVNNHVYVLDGSQKNSWANTKTNLQYEAYYLDNVPVHHFAKYEGDLWFADQDGNMCRFKDEGDVGSYRDGYPTDPDWTSSQIAGDAAYAIPISRLTPQKGQTEPKAGETILYEYNGTRRGYTIKGVGNGIVTCYDGVPITAVWSTIADDDGAVHFFKNLKKKGSLVSLLPTSDSGVRIYVKPDRKEPVFVCESDAKQTDIPFDVYMKKKVKKYKRLQIICENSTLDDAFGVDQIIKCYTMGNYSKNRG